MQARYGKIHTEIESVKSNRVCCLLGRETAAEIGKKFSSFLFEKKDFYFFLINEFNYKFIGKE